MELERKTVGTLHRWFTAVAPRAFIFKWVCFVALLDVRCLIPLQSPKTEVKLNGEQCDSCQTAVVDNSDNPSWNQEISLDVSSMNDDITFDVWDEDSAAADDFLGKTHPDYLPFRAEVNAKIEVLKSDIEVLKSWKLLYVATTRKYSGASVSAVTRTTESKYTGLARRELSRRPFMAWSSAGITCSSFSK